MAEPQPRPSESSEPAHDVLAAEAFAVPAPDPELRHGPLELPEDPTGIPEPHDILAAEEFPMPSPRRRTAATKAARARTARRSLIAVGIGLLARAIARRARA